MGKSKNKGKSWKLTYESGAIFLSMKKFFVQSIKLWKQESHILIVPIRGRVQDAVTSKFYEPLYALTCQLKTTMLKLLATKFYVSFSFFLSFSHFQLLSSILALQFFEYMFHLILLCLCACGCLCLCACGCLCVGNMGGSCKYDQLQFLAGIEEPSSMRLKEQTNHGLHLYMTVLVSYFIGY